MKQTLKAAFLILNYRLNAHEVDRYLFHRLKLFFLTKKPASNIQSLGMKRESQVLEEACGCLLWTRNFMRFSNEGGAFQVRLFITI